jgi:tellurite resistance protein
LVSASIGKDKKYSGKPSQHARDNLNFAVALACGDGDLSVFAEIYIRSTGNIA